MKNIISMLAYAFFPRMKAGSILAAYSASAAFLTAVVAIAKPKEELLESFCHIVVTGACWVIIEFIIIRVRG